jgi:predicted nuclease of predicted toxin-antitoxin system
MPCEIFGLRDATDKEIFTAAQQAKSIVMTKDSDFVALLNLYGPPPQILWITCGNTSNAYLRQVLLHTFPQAIALFQQGEKLVEIRGEHHL